MLELLPLLLFVVVCLFLLLGYPVALTLAGVSLLFAGLGVAFDWIHPALLNALPNRLYGIIDNYTLIAVPLFVFMGVTLERTKISEDLLSSMGALFGGMRGGLGLAVIVVGTLLAASTGIVGATVVTMGLLSLPAMMRLNYDKGLATGVICASGTLGQLIPPSIVLVLLGDVLGSAYTQAQATAGIWPPKAVSVGDLFVGALLPGLVLVFLYMVWVMLVAWRKPQAAPAMAKAERARYKANPWKLLRILLLPLVLILAVLGSILFGIATPTEAAGVGALGALLLAAFGKKLSFKVLQEIGESTLKTSSMVFLILIGASLFSLVFRAYDGDALMHAIFDQLPGGVFGAMLLVMVMMFLLGFIIDFIEIIFVVVPIVAPVLLAMGLDPVWLGVMIAINLQTSFLTPPFGFALFYLRGVAPPNIKTSDMYRGVVPFIGIQILMIGLLAFFPELATALPQWVYGG